MGNHTQSASPALESRRCAGRGRRRPAGIRTTQLLAFTAAPIGALWVFRWQASLFVFALP
ncbi:hypothetical protein [Streptomyces sp. NPDC002172]